MISRIYVVYDNSLEPCYDVKNIIGEKSFGEVIYKRKTLRDRLFEVINKYSFISRIIKINNELDWHKCESIISNSNKETKIFHLFSEYVIKDENEFDLIIQKMQYVKENILIIDNDEIIGIIFDNTEAYIKYLKNTVMLRNSKLACNEIETSTMQTKAFFGLNNLSNFLQYITGGFDARFFNSLSGDEYIVTKSSTNKDKIKSEYMFYYLIPDEMKKWFVIPYNYTETDTTASYTMERLHMTDVAIRWVHGAIAIDEFEKLLKRIFYFIDSRKEKPISKEEYENVSNKLYINKLKQRIESLKNHEKYFYFEQYIKVGTKYNDIDEIINKYILLYNKFVKSSTPEYKSVIGHGDLCFSNMLYNKETATLKLIDTKGAQKEEDIWTNPYYDIAKLSHSICGKYDFFNNGMYEIKMDLDLKFELTIDFDNSEYINIFKKYLKKSGYDYNMIRILESSLFLSMLPLHMDFPQKVFGFLLNAINILEEIESNV